MVRNINFYTGGFQSKIRGQDEHVCSTFNIKNLKSFGGSAYVGILEQGFHVEGVTSKNKLSYLGWPS